MRALLPALLALACTGSADDEPLIGDQLRGLGVNVDGNNVLHASVPQPGDPTHLGAVPLQVDEYIDAGFARLSIVGTVPDWEAELVGDLDAFTFVLDADFFNLLVGIRCVPPAVGAYAVDMVVTSPSQPGREFRVGFACDGDDGYAIAPFEAQEIAADGTLAGTGSQAVEVQPGGRGPAVELPGSLFGVVVPGGLGSDGSVVFTANQALYAASPTQPAQPLPAGGASVSTPIAAAGGSRVAYSDGSRMWQVDRQSGDAAAYGPSGLFTAVTWASDDGRHAMIASGNGSTRPLTLIDTASGDATPLTRSDGSAWNQQIGSTLASLSPDLTEGLEVTSYFGDVAIRRVDLDTGEGDDLLAPAAADCVARGLGRGLSISGVSVSPDWRWLGVVFDNITADPGGFRLDGSAVYVISLTDGRTWLASALPDGRPIDFAKGGFDGRLLEHVRVRPNGEAVLFGRRYVIDRRHWVEVE